MVTRLKFMELNLWFITFREGFSLSIAAHLDHLQEADLAQHLQSRFALQ